MKSTLIDPEKYLNENIRFFDSLDLENKYIRRMAVKPLYDFFQSFILEVAVRFCGFNRKPFSTYGLETRWKLLKSIIMIIEDPTKWDQIIKQIHNARSSVDHNDYFFPTTRCLSDVRKRAPEFGDWLITVAKNYFRISKGFSFLEQYSVLFRRFSGQADLIIQRYGVSPPYVAKTDRGGDFNLIKPLTEKIGNRLSDIRSINDFKKEDVINLIELVKQIERLDAREDAFLFLSICPKCGGKIVETTTNIGGTIDNPEPVGAIYRIGCEKCDYVLNSETIDF